MIMSSCKNYSELDIQGHRGCRGLFPENTIAGFLEACKLGVSTLEMDVVISADGSVIISHEAFFNHEISTSPFQVPITQENEKEFNIYLMTTPTVKSFDVGLKVHPRFPDQKKIEAYKPTLSEVVKAVKEAGYEPNYNIEIKRSPEGDGIFHPSALSFTSRVVEEIMALGIADKTTVQSFDHESVNLVKVVDSNMRTVILVEDENSLDWHLNKLEHVPYAYSPNFKLVDTELIKKCRDKGLKIIPWTVNEVADMKKLLELGVDGIITDYPDRLIKLVK
jgi:glycerophosphoryl diester phosphodiesterase